jgi:hypothetical protein
MTKNRLAALVVARETAAAVDEQTTGAVLTEAMERFAQPTDDHAVWWNGQTWVDAAPWSEKVRERLRALCDGLDDHSRNDGWRLICRTNVFARADDPLDLFLAAIAWGFGNRGYGWRRTADIIDGAAEMRVRRAVEDLRDAATNCGYAGVWLAWSRDGIAKLSGLDTAFASKLAYFACFDRTEGRGPLIADLNTAWALWALTGIWDSRKSAGLYREYVEWAERKAHGLDCRPDDIERALFAVGPDIRRVWKQLRKT